MTGRSVTGEQYGRFLIDVFEEWVRHDVGDGLRADVRCRARELGRRAAALCIHSETCGSALALEHTGDLYSCDHFVEPAYQLGNIREPHMLDLVGLAAAAAVRARQARDAAAVLRRVRRALRLPRRLPEGPVHRDTRRRARAELPVRRLQGLLPPRRPAHAVHGRAAAPAAARRPRSCASTRQRTRSAGATPLAPAGQGASGSNATAVSASAYPPCPRSSIQIPDRTPVARQPRTGSKSRCRA